MPAFIIHKDGAYNVFSTVVDACYFEPALTLDELREWYRPEYGEAGMRVLPARLERAHSTGSSAISGSHEPKKNAETWAFRQVPIADGEDEPNEAVVAALVPEFYRRFLTLPSNDGGAQK